MYTIKHTTFDVYNLTTQHLMYSLQFNHTTMWCIQWQFVVMYLCIITLVHGCACVRVRVCVCVCVCVVLFLMTLLRNLLLIIKTQMFTLQEVPATLFEMTYLREWHINATKILKIPEFIAMFQELSVLDIPKNCIDELPAEIGNPVWILTTFIIIQTLCDLETSILIWPSNQTFEIKTRFLVMTCTLVLFTGKLTQLRELNASYNKLSTIPPELGDCENLERLELTSNVNLMELPFEVRDFRPVW